MHNRKMSVRLAYILGQLFVNGGVILVMVGVWVLSFVVVVQAKLSVWIILLGIFAGPLVAWIWWSFSTPRWREFASRYLDEIEMEELHQAAVQGQLEWPKGHVFSRTEMKSRNQKWKDADAAISDLERYLDDEFDPGKRIDFSGNGGDSRVIEEIRIFVKNLRYRMGTSGHAEISSNDLRMIDGFISRLNSIRQDLKKSSVSNDENWDWYGLISDLINQLNHLKKVLRAIR